MLWSAEPELAGLCAEQDCELVLMHMLGTPRTMQTEPRYDNVLREVIDFLAGRIQFAARAGIERQNIIVDPGIGFGKTLDHNLALLRGLPAFAALGQPLLVGAHIPLGAAGLEDDPQVALPRQRPEQLQAAEGQARRALDQVRVEHLEQRDAHDRLLERRDPLDRPALGVAADELVGLLGVVVGGVRERPREARRVLRQDVVERAVGHLVLVEREGRRAPLIGPARHGELLTHGRST